MVTDKTHVIVFHGTTSAFDESIREHGFQINPERRPSHQMNGDEHLCSFDGTYVALDRDTSRYYANAAAEQNGGDPRIYVLRVPVSVIVPDEDEVHFSLSCHLAAPMGFDEMADDDDQYAKTPWSVDIARHAMSTISEGFGMTEKAAEQAAIHLHTMVEFAIKDWDGNLFLFHPDGNDKGWSSPAWVRKLTSLEGGSALYREQMDLLLNCMRGASPEAFPAGYETFKGRVVVPFGFENDGAGIEIIGYGSIADPFEDYSDFSSYQGTEMCLDPAFFDEAKYIRQSQALTV
jgi:hypothetical protein